MPAVSVSDITVLPRVVADPHLSVRKVKSVTTAPSGFEGEGFPVRRAFRSVSTSRFGDDTCHSEEEIGRAHV